MSVFPEPLDIGIQARERIGAARIHRDCQRLRAFFLDTGGYQLPQ